MITGTTAWNAKNALPAKRPIFIASIAGFTTVYTTHDLVQQGITGTLPAYHAWLKTPTGSTQNIDVQSGTSSIGEIACEVVDVGGAMRTFVGTNAIEGALMTLSVGYPGTAITDFMVVHTHRIYKVLPSKFFNSFIFSARDIQMDAKMTVWNHPLNGEPLSPINPWILQGTPCEIIQQIWLLGLRYPESTIDVAYMQQLDAVAEAYYSVCRPFRFEMDEPFTVLDFLENEIYKPSGMYPVVTNLGQLSVRGYRPLQAGPVPVFAFTQDNCTAFPNFDRAPILNDLLWQMDAAGTYSNSGSHNTTLLYTDATSISNFGRSNERQIQSKGLRTELGAQWFAQDISTRMFARFAGTTGLRGGAPVVSVNAFFMTLPVWVGDYVSLSGPKIPDLFTGALGLTNRLFEVIDRTPDYAGGKMSFKLLDTGLTGAPVATQIGSAVIDTTTVY
jgi:hypothetical protein